MVDRYGGIKNPAVKDAVRRYEAIRKKQKESSSRSSRGGSSNVQKPKVETTPEVEKPIQIQTSVTLDSSRSRGEDLAAQLQQQKRIRYMVDLERERRKSGMSSIEAVQRRRERAYDETKFRIEQENFKSKKEFQDKLDSLANREKYLRKDVPEKRVEVKGMFNIVRGPSSSSRVERISPAEEYRQQIRERFTQPKRETIIDRPNFIKTSKGTNIDLREVSGNTPFPVTSYRGERLKQEFKEKPIMTSYAFAKAGVEKADDVVGGALDKSVGDVEDYVYGVGTRLGFKEPEKSPDWLRNIKPIDYIRPEIMSRDEILGLKFAKKQKFVKENPLLRKPVDFYLGQFERPSKKPVSTLIRGGLTAGAGLTFSAGASTLSPITKYIPTPAVNIVKSGLFTLYGVGSAQRIAYAPTAYEAGGKAFDIGLEIGGFQAGARSYKPKIKPTIKSKFESRQSLEKTVYRPKRTKIINIEGVDKKGQIVNKKFLSQLTKKSELTSAEKFNLYKGNKRIGVGRSFGVGGKKGVVTSVINIKDRGIKLKYVISQNPKTTTISTFKKNKFIGKEFLKTPKSYDQSTIFDVSKNNKVLRIEDNKLLFQQSKVFSKNLIVKYPNIKVKSFSRGAVTSESFLKSGFSRKSVKSLSYGVDEHGSFIFKKGVGKEFFPSKLNIGGNKIPSSFIVGKKSGSEVLLTRLNIPKPSGFQKGYGLEKGFRIIKTDIPKKFPKLGKKARLGSLFYSFSDLSKTKTNFDLPIQKLNPKGFMSNTNLLRSETFGQLKSVSSGSLGFVLDPRSISKMSVDNKKRFKSVQKNFNIPKLNLDFTSVQKSSPTQVNVNKVTSIQKVTPIQKTLTETSSKTKTTQLISPISSPVIPPPPPPPPIPPPIPIPPIIVPPRLNLDFPISSRVNKKLPFKLLPSERGRYSPSMLGIELFKQSGKTIKREPKRFPGVGIRLPTQKSVTGFGLFRKPKNKKSKKKKKK